MDRCEWLGRRSRQLPSAGRSRWRMDGKQKARVRAFSWYRPVGDTFRRFNPARCDSNSLLTRGWLGHRHLPTTRTGWSRSTSERCPPAAAAPPWWSKPRAARLLKRRPSALRQGAARCLGNLGAGCWSDHDRRRKVRNRQAMVVATRRHSCRHPRVGRALVSQDRMMSQGVTFLVRAYLIIANPDSHGHRL